MKDIRIGRISSINYNDGTADVYFKDEEDHIITDLPFFSNEYKMPDINDNVVVIFQSNNSSQGFILGPFYNKNNKPEHSGKNVYFKRFSKKSFIRYDPEKDMIEISADKVVIKNLSQE